METLGFPDGEVRFQDRIERFSGWKSVVSLWEIEGYRWKSKVSRRENGFPYGNVRFLSRKKNGVSSRKSGFPVEKTGSR